MPQVDWSQFGRRSARTKLELIAVLALLLLAGAAYYRGKRNAELREQVGVIEKARAINADSIVLHSKAVDRATQASDSAHVAAKVAVARAGGFHLQSVPANRTDPALIRKLYATIANRDTALVLKDTAIAKLTRENTLLLVERSRREQLVVDLNRQVALDVNEINKLKKFKAPRFGWKTGIAAGMVGTIGIISLKK